MTKHDILRRYFGHHDFREGQEELIDRLLEGGDVLGIMPTGAGKSMCYQIPAMLISGISLIISPLISLMKDQVGTLRQSGVPCAFINSSLDASEYYATLRLAEEGEYKLIYVAPERLATEDFAQFAANADISLIAVDEAHCVSHWGQDFRPSYLKIPEFISALPRRPVVSAFTATATEAVREDICRLLELRSPYTLVTGFDRENLFFDVRKPSSKLGELFRIIEENKERSGIVYCSTRKNVESVCDALNEKGIPATRYHAGLSDDERRMNQDSFIFDRCRVMVATNAFGMGIDKSNVSYVVHYNMPKSPESYYQEAGRAGRDGEPAHCVILYSGQDVHTNQFLIDKSSDENTELSDKEREEIRSREHDRLKQMTFYCTTQYCLRKFLLNYFGENAKEACGNCSNCTSDAVATDITLDAKKIISCVYRAAQRRRAFGKVMITDILRGSKNEKIISAGMETLSTYGIMSEVPSARIRLMIDYLIEEGYLELNGGDFPAMYVGKNARDVLVGNKSLSMKLPSNEKNRDKPQKKSQTHVCGEAVDEALFEKLRGLRREFADKQNVPAYFIFSDAVLTCMCRMLPKNSEDFLAVPGVGNAKAERYGEAFMSVIREHCAAAETV